MKRDIPQAVFESKDAMRIAKIATKQAEDELNDTPRHLLNRGNPNHPDNFDVQLFGYNTNEFLAKQYK